MPPLRPALVLAATVFLCACRQGSANTAGSLRLVPSASGTQGCAPFAGAVATATPVFTSPFFGAKSQIAAATGGSEDTFFWTGGNGSVHRLSLPSGMDDEFVPPGTIEAQYLVPAGITESAELSGIAVLDDTFLVVAEHASNSLLLIERTGATPVVGLAGLADAAGGFASGEGDAIRFHFGAAVPLYADASGLVFVGDTENHAVREVVPAAPPFAVTIAGSGAAGPTETGSLGSTQFDTPSGFAASCGGELLVVEAGAAGAGGHRLVSLSIGPPALFGGGLTGDALVLAGDGTPATSEGTGTVAQLDAPMGLASTADGLAFWVDSQVDPQGTQLGNPILRRYAFATGLCDCPGFSDCASAAAGSSLTGTNFSVVVGASGALYVLGTTATGGTLWRME